MKFTFRLQTLWKLRVAEREERQLKLSEAERADDILRTQGEELELELAEMARGLWAGSQPGAVNVDRLLDTERYELVLVARREVLRAQRVRLAAEIERRREALVEADRQVKVLEKLRDKGRLEHVRREEALEVKRLDEIALRRKREPAS